MTLEVASRGYTDNLRKFKRYLQGKGVNLRETIVSADAYADVRIAVPGLQDDDAIISVINLTDLIDVTGYLDDSGEYATHEYGSSDARFTVTALKSGVGGNAIALKAAAGSGVSSPLAVSIGDRDTLFGTSGHPGGTGILVTLATNSGGTLDTTDPNGPNSAKNVRVAILDAQEQLHQENIVDVTIANGNGEDPVGAISATALSGGSSFKQGPSTAVLVTDLDDTSPYTEASDLRYEARVPGVLGNDISVIYTAGGSLAVAVSDEQITVTYVVGVTTAKDVMDAVNANKSAAHLVKVSLGPGAGDGDGVVATMTESFLTGGLDGGIQFSVATDSPLSAKTLKVLWVTRGENTPAGEA